MGEIETQYEVMPDKGTSYASENGKFLITYYREKTHLYCSTCSKKHDRGFFINIRRPIVMDVRGQKAIKLPKLPAGCDGVILKNYGPNCDITAYYVRDAGTQVSDASEDALRRKGLFHRLLYYFIGRDRQFYLNATRVLDSNLPLLKSALASDHYLLLPDYKTRLDLANQALFKYRRSYLKKKSRFNKEALNQFRVSFRTLDETVKDYDSKLKEHNRLFLDRNVEKAYKLIDLVEDRTLDREQMEAIVKDVPNHLVVAGAGTGKTTTILGKIKYLLKREECRPEEILVLSFTNASASEMASRLRKEVCAEIKVCTFHRLGYDIVRLSEKIAPLVYTDNLLNFIARQIQKHMADQEYQSLLTDSVFYDSISDKSEFDFECYDDYIHYLNLNPPTTMLHERVKSYGEMDIANFLARNGVSYVYEWPYEYDTRDAEHAQYRPDFYLPDYKVYIEYYGIDRKGKTPSYFEGRHGKDGTTEYNEGIKWKRELHKQHGTKLIECYAYEKFEGVLIKNLEAKLKEAKVIFSPISFDQLSCFFDHGTDRILDSIARCAVKVINLARNRNMSSSYLIRLARMDKDRNSIVLAKIIAPLMDDYEAELKQHSAIDFADMLNKATRHVENGDYIHNFKYVIVDEYQDISTSQFNLLSALRKQRQYQLFCVGDDWQSIYNFAGSNIDYILNFGRYWGTSETSRIQTTYRFPQSIIEVSSKFVMQNPAQIRKSIHSYRQNDDKRAVSIVNGENSFDVAEKIVSILSSLPKESSVFLLGRYNFDVNIFDGNADIYFKYNNQKEEARGYLEDRPDLKVSFFTVHKSKGLQADYVFILNNQATTLGFPSQIQNPHLIDLLLDNSDSYQFAEERRLFYVALTRARRKVFLVTCGKDESIFIAEFRRNNLT